MKKSLFILILLQAATSFAQVVTALDCSNAVNICSSSSFSVAPSGTHTADFTGAASSNVTNPTNSPAGVIPPGGAGCLLAGELNPTWMIINVHSGGTLEFSLGAGTGPGAQAGCYDWILWPYNFNTCININNNTLAPLRCCWNSFCSGGTGLSSSANLPSGGHQEDFGAPLNVNCGDKYVICFSNYSSVATAVPLNFFGTASVSCTSNTTAPSISISGNSMICLGQTTTLTASGATSYTWSTGTISPSIAVTPSTSAVYSVNGDNPGGCQGSGGIIVTVSACTGIIELLNSSSVLLYPNPANEKLTIENITSENMVFELINSLGQTLLKKDLDPDKNLIPIHEFPPGIYYYRVLRNEKVISSAKLIFQ
jgi:hypothetical protein